MLFVIYSISIPLFNYGNVAVTLGFILNYTTIFFAALFIKSRGLIRRYIILHAFGLLASCIVRYIGYSISTIDQYFQGIESDYGFLAKGTYHNRFSGMDEDPNYFAIQVLIALACLLVCIYFEKKKRIRLIVLFTSLTIFGILSYSKMFLLVLAALAIISFFMLLRENRKFALNYILLVSLAGGITFYNYYDYFYSAFLVRFGSGIDSVSDITTGRFDIWLLYVKGIFSDVRVLLLGEGYGAGALNSIGAHNMYLTALYYMGILGLVVTLSFFNCMKLVIRTNLTVKSRFKIFSISSIPFLILLIANFSLDSFVMDFFPFQLLLLMACFCYKEGIQLKDDMLLSKVS